MVPPTPASTPKESTQKASSKKLLILVIAAVLVIIAAIVAITLYKKSSSSCSENCGVVTPSQNNPAFQDFDSGAAAKGIDPRYAGGGWKEAWATETGVAKPANVSYREGGKYLFVLDANSVVHALEFADGKVKQEAWSAQVPAEGCAAWQDGYACKDNFYRDGKAETWQEALKLEPAFEDEPYRMISVNEKDLYLYAGSGIGIIGYRVNLDGKITASGIIGEGFDEPYVGRDNVVWTRPAASDGGDGALGGMKVAKLNPGAQPDTNVFPNYVEIPSDAAVVVLTDGFLISSQEYAGDGTAEEQNLQVVDLQGNVTKSLKVPGNLLIRAEDFILNRADVNTALDSIAQTAAPNPQQLYFIVKGGQVAQYALEMPDKGALVTAAGETPVIAPPTGAYAVAGGTIYRTNNPGPVGAGLLVDSFTGKIILGKTGLDPDEGVEQAASTTTAPQYYASFGKILMFNKDGELTLYTPFGR